MNEISFKKVHAPAVILRRDGTLWYVDGTVWCDNETGHRTRALYPSRPGSAIWISEDELVTPIDLDFLLACASDRLQESEAYTAGYNAGQERMRARVIEALMNRGLIVEPEGLG